MTLITRLEDSEEGLIGTTKQGEKVHLGTPLPFSEVHNLRTDDGNTATKRLQEEAEKFEREIEERADFVYFDRERSNHVSYHIEDIPLRRWFSDGKFVRNYGAKLTYLQFDTKKEEAFRRQGQEHYCPESIYGGDSYVKIHRAGEIK